MHECIFWRSCAVLVMNCVVLYCFNRKYVKMESLKLSFVTQNNNQVFNFYRKKQKIQEDIFR